MQKQNHHTCMSALAKCCLWTAAMLQPPKRGPTDTNQSLQAVLALGAGWCVYTWLSWGGCKPHAAHHQSRVECSSHSTVSHVMSLKVWKRISADRGGVWNDEDSKFLRVKASVKCGVVDIWHTFNDDTQLFPFIWSLIPGHHVQSDWSWTFSIHLKFDSRSLCAMWLDPSNGFCPGHSITSSLSVQLVIQQ